MNRSIVTATRRLDTLRLILCIGLSAISTEAFGHRTHLRQSSQQLLNAAWLDFDSEYLETAFDEILSAYGPVQFDINTIQPDDLESFPGIRSSDIEALMTYRHERGPFISVDEIDRITSILPLTRYLLKRVLWIQPSSRARPRRGKPIVSVRIRTSRTWNSRDPVAGNGLGLYRKTLRVSAKSKALEFGLTGQNDPGEKLYWNPRNGWFLFDHISSYVAWTSPRSKIKIILGDYKLDAGQGLIHSRPFGVRLTPSAPWRVIREASGITGYSGATRQRTFRGPTIRIRPVTNVFTWFFLSAKHVDAEKVGFPDSLASNASVHKLVQSDLHISGEQISRRNGLSFRTVGFLLEWRKDKHRVGLIVSRTAFGHPVLLDATLSPSRYFTYGSLFWKLSTASLTISGEAARNVRSNSIVAGIVGRPASSLSVFASVRSISSRSNTLFGRPFGVLMNLGEQGGFTLGTRVVVSGHLSVATSFDHLWAAGARSVPFFPIGKSTFTLSLSHKLPESIAIEFRLRSASKQVRSNSYSESGSLVARYGLLHTSSSTALIHYASTRATSLRIRIDANHSRDESGVTSHGFHAATTCSVELHKRIRATFQLSLFNSPLYENRFYVYEPDVDGKLIAPVLDRSGSRSMVLLEYELWNRAILEMKYGATDTDGTRDDQRNRNSQQTPMPIPGSRFRSFGLQFTTRF